jgi:hypothetical protein
MFTPSMAGRIRANAQRAFRRGQALRVRRNVESRAETIEAQIFGNLAAIFPERYMIAIFS